jgi:hypothetical protein
MFSTKISNKGLTPSLTMSFQEFSFDLILGIEQGTPFAVSEQLQGFDLLLTVQFFRLYFEESGVSF